LLVSDGIARAGVLAFDNACAEVAGVSESALEFIRDLSSVIGKKGFVSDGIARAGVLAFDSACAEVAGVSESALEFTRDLSSVIGKKEFVSEFFKSK
jgi:hypothetical protein